MADPNTPKACKSCSASKAKCARPPEGGACTRCAKLKRECIAQVVVRRKKTPRLTRTAQLEKKLDGIVSLLGGIQPSLVGKDLSAAAAAAQEEATGDENESPRSIPYATPSSDSNGLPPAPAPEPENERNAPVVVNLPLPEEEGERILHIYRTELLPTFPFVPLPAMTAGQLFRQKPLVYRAVLMMGLYKDAPRQGAMSVECRRYLAEHLVMNGEKSLDLLQGLMLYLGWYHFHLHHANSQMTTLASLMQSLMLDLGLHKSVFTQPAEKHLQFVAEALPPPPPNSTYVSSLLKGGLRTLEDRRALLGGYYLSSVISCTFSRIDALKYTASMKESATMLLEAKEHDTDRYLVYAVQVTNIIENIRSSGLLEYISDPDTPRTPVSMLIKMFRNDLQNFWDTLPADMQQNKFLFMHYQTALILLYDPSLHPSAPAAPLFLSLPYSSNIAASPAATRTSTPPSHNLDHTTHLYACFNAVQAFQNVFNDLSLQILMTISLPFYGQMSHAIQALSRLSLLSAPDFDSNWVRQSCDLVAHAEKMCLRMQEMGRISGQDANGAFWICAKKCRWIKTWFEQKVAAEGGGPAVNAVNGVNGVNGGNGGNGTQTQTQGVVPMEGLAGPAGTAGPAVNGMTGQMNWPSWDSADYVWPEDQFWTGWDAWDVNAAGIVGFQPMPS